MAKLNRQEELTELFNKLVPRNGNAKTVAGEIVRALNRIIYRWYNDGDKVGNGYGKETVNPAVRYLASIKGLNSNKVIKDFLDEADGYYRLKNYEKDLEQLLSVVLDFLEENSELMLKKNTDDFWDFADNKLDKDDSWDDSFSDNLDDQHIIRDTFNAIKSQCKTREQRIAFNKLITSFASASNMSKEELRKFVNSRFNKASQAGEYNILALIKFIQENSIEQPLSNLGGRLNQIELDGKLLLSYSYEKNIKKITCGLYSIVGQWINNSWTWWIKGVGLTQKKNPSGMDVLEIVNKMLDTKYPK